ncbi:WD_REPEATS_REGION domain-containing protein, partial [Serendipita sp. 396]
MALPLGGCHEIAPTMDDQRKRNTLKKLFHKESTKMDLHKDPVPNAPADGDNAPMMGVELSTSTSLSDAASSASQLFHQSESSQAFQEACEIAEQLFGIVKDVSEATELLSPLKSASALMMRGIQAVRAVHSNSTSWVDLCNDLLPHVSQMEEWKGQLEKKGVIVSRGCLAVLNQYLNIAAEIIKTAAEYGAKRANFLGLLRRAGTVQTEKEEIARLRQKATNMWQAFIAAMNMDVFHGVDQIQAQLAMPGALAATLTRSIGVSVSRTAYGTKLDICEEGTRAEVLMEIRTWATSVATDGQIFWLKGAGGTGKSTIAATMTREWSQQGTLAGRFFFSPNNVAERTTDNFCLTIAEDIAVNQPILNGTVRQAIISTPLDHFSFDQQFDRLVIRPLLAYPYMHSLYIVIDALDNCEDLDQRERLLETLMRFLPSAKQVKMLLTSRPLQDITAMVNGCPLVDSGHAELLDSQDKAHKDIEIYVERKLGNHPMVSAEQRHMIVEQSGGLFLYAATICRLLKDLRRPTLLRAVTFSGSPQGLAQRMDELYLSILKQVCVDNTLDESFMEVLSMIIMAFQPLSINTISEYLPGNEYVAHTVQSLGAVLKTDGPDHSIKVLHPTFREFLLSDKERATGFLVNPVESHVKLAYGCIGVLEDLLCCNVIQIDPKLQSTPLNATIPDLGSRLAQYISPAAEYASVFWTHHVEASDPDDSRLLWSRVLRFLSEMLLNWVELMSWKGEVVRCIDGLSRLHTKAKQISSESLDILSHDDMLTIRQAHQFVVYHQDVISESALQVYSVALFFTPYDSPIFEHYRAHYHSRRPTIIAPYITDWGNHVTLGNHAGTVELVLLSPDGTRFISAGKCRSTGFGGSELFLWDIETGALIRRLSQGQRIGRCRFSPDGQYLAFQAEFQLHVHSSKTGEPTMSPIEFSLDEYHRVYHFFSQGRPYITWLSLSLARIVNFKTGRSVRLVYLARDVHCTSVSLDGRRLATMHIVPDSGTQITLWDWTTFTSITTIMDSQHLNDGLLSADGARLASWNLDSLRLWNVSTDKGFEKPVELEGGFVCVSFSLYGKYFARLSRADLKVWDCESGACVLTETVSADGTIESGGYNISFAGNEQKLALTTGKWSEEPIVRIWALPSGQPLDPMTPSHPTRGRSSLCQLSADWTKWILATRDNELNLYNLQEINKR